MTYVEGFGYFIESFEKRLNLYHGGKRRSISGVTEFLTSRQNEINLHTPPKYATDLDKEDLELIHDFGSLSTQQLMDKIKHLQNLAYQVGLEEAKEMTRGKFLNILGKR
ncbi:unnamed protein product [Schistosoma bovis]|nr:unnamed protein product [Schistosoma bovis]